MSEKQENEIMIPAWVDGTLLPREKLLVHLEGLKHKAVSIFVMRGDRMLLQRRAMEKYHTPGLWANTCCTHPHWGETAQDCGQRRLNDELGLSGLSLNHRGTIEYHARVSQNMIEHEVVDLFVAQADQTLNLRPNPHEVMATRWLSITNLSREIEAQPEKFTPWLRIYLKKYAQRIFDF